MISIGRTTIAYLLCQIEKAVVDIKSIFCTNFHESHAVMISQLFSFSELYLPFMLL